MAKQRGAGRRAEIETEDGLEIGEAVVAAEAGLVAEEQEHAGEGQRLGHDREVHALDPRAEAKKPKTKASTPGTSTTRHMAQRKLDVPYQYQGSSFQARKLMNAGRPSPALWRIRYMPIA